MLGVVHGTRKNRVKNGNRGRMPYIYVHVAVDFDLAVH